MAFLGVLLCACIQLSLQSPVNEPALVEELVPANERENEQDTMGSRRAIVNTSRKRKSTLNQKEKQSSARTSVRKEKALSAVGVDKVINTKCCKKRCTMKILNKGDVLKCRKTYRALSEEEQRSFIMSFFTLSAYHHQDYIASCADRIPNEDKYCLPTCLTKREVYLTYRDDLKSAGVRTVSWATFSRMWKKRFRNVIIPKEGRLPPYLFLQMDNCYRECKNRYILGFCSLLVEKGIFKEVRLSFLMVGHTHEDVDQFFSRISRRLHKKDSMTLPALVRNIHKAHTPAPDVHVLKYVFDIKAWLEPYLNSVKRHVYPHAYKFFKRDGQVTMRYKKWANDKTWLPDGPSLHMLNGKPRGIPVLVRPETKKLMDIKDLQESVKKCSRLTNEDQMWWSSFVNKEKAFRAKWATASADMLAKEKRSEWQLDKLKNHRPVKAPSETDPDQQQREETLENLLQKANHFPDVSCV
ncbi:hypothetical protein ACROYT_G037583 [Oculina patagonica]